MTKELEQAAGEALGRILTNAGVKLVYPFDATLLKSVQELCKYMDKNFISRQELVELADKAKVEAGKSEHPIRAISFNAGIEAVISFINPPISKE